MAFTRSTFLPQVEREKGSRGVAEVCRRGTPLDLWVARKAPSSHHINCWAMQPTNHCDDDDGGEQRYDFTHPSHTPVLKNTLEGGSVRGRGRRRDKGALMAEEGSGGEAAEPDREVLLISAGASHSVALLSGRDICSWGRGEDGQLGHGDAEDRLRPTLLSSLDSRSIVSVTCGADHTTAYSESDDQVYSWGWGDFGRLGHGNSSDVFTPQPIKVLQGLKIKQIACGDSHCLAVTMNGEVQRQALVTKLILRVLWHFVSLN
ncbi:hypothetical protein B296_00038128 [Ensete ventricosum]|uniref:Uncharacterized protein n=1 Tax=Ensete ventricosum TaxID=4639 RepID=A0A426Z535_ENSVE|nr:hypothetical protein B296_00038128 [Ensete ventricosum]